MIEHFFGELVLFMVPSNIPNILLLFPPMIKAQNKRFSKSGYIFYILLAIRFPPAPRGSVDPPHLLSFVGHRTIQQNQPEGPTTEVRSRWLSCIIHQSSAGGSLRDGARELAVPAGLHDQAGLIDPHDRTI
jgi:hypothetical protein